MTVQALTCARCGAGSVSYVLPQEGQIGEEAVCSGCFDAHRARLHPFHLVTSAVLGAVNRLRVGFPVTEAAAEELSLLLMLAARGEIRAELAEARAKERTA